MGCEKLRRRSAKLSSLERNRYSVFTDNLDYCYFCGKPRTDLHEIIYGSNRLNSMKWGYVLPLCRSHHDSFHKNHVLTREWAAKCQDHFESIYCHQDWLDTFHKNYK